MLITMRVWNALAIKILPWIQNNCYFAVNNKITLNCRPRANICIAVSLGLSIM